MKKHVKRMIKEHKKLQKKYNKIVAYIVKAHDGDVEIHSDEDFAYMRIQQNGMATYLIALEERLNNHGITVVREEGV